MSNEIKKGLAPLPRDKRDYALGAFPFLRPEKIPNFDFFVGSSEILDQKDTDFCSAFATCAASAIEENKTLNPYWSFAVSKIGQDIMSYGNDLRTACQVHIDYGANEYDSEYALNVDDPVKREWLRDIKTYPRDLFDKAKKHKKKTYFSVNKIFQSTFDSIAAALWKYKDEKRAVITGLLWNPMWTSLKDGIIPTDSQQGSYGHAFIFIGQKIIENKPYLVAQLSNSEAIGDKGFFYFPKEIVDKECTFGNYLFIDMPEGWGSEDIKKISKYYNSNFFGKLISFFTCGYLFHKMLKICYN